MKNLNFKKDKAQITNEKLKTENAKLLKEKDNSKEKLAKLVEEKVKYEGENVKIKKENERLLIENEDYWKENCHLKKMKKSFKKKVFMFENNEAVLKRKCSYLDEKVKKLVLENQGILNDVGKINYVNIKLKMEVELENLKLKQKVEEVVKENNNLKDQLSSMTNKARIISSRIKNIEQKHSKLKLYTVTILKLLEKKKKKFFCF